MKITESGFYCIKEISGDTSCIEIAPDLEVSLFDFVSKDRNIIIGEKSNVDVFFLLDSSLMNDENKINIHVHQNQKYSKLHLRSLLLSKNNKKIDVKICSEISSDHAQSDVKILSIIGEKGNISLDGIVKINQGISGVEGYLEEENLFLGTSGKIKGIPTLLVESDDVKASHSCKIERMSDEQLFYLRSRGIGKENAMDMMIESYITDLFSGLERIEKDFFKKVFEDIIIALK